MQGLADDIASHEELARVYHGEVDFDGTTAAELQQVLDASQGKLAHITTPDLVLDQPIDVPSDTHIDGTGSRIWCEVPSALFLVEGQRGVSLENLDISGNADIAVFARDASDLVVGNCHIHDLRGKAVVVVGSSAYFHILDNEFRQNRQGGITVGGGSSYGMLRGNRICSNTGYSNWMAGMVLTNVDAESPETLWSSFPGETPHFVERHTLAGIPASAHDVIVRDNTVEHNQSSGVYLDGVYRCYLTGNTIQHNDKEGMCLDGGTLGCFVQGNTVADNGKRARQSEAALALDGMLDFGYLEDGSAVAKLPGISLDNAAYNTLEANTVRGNWGCGIKAVRCAVRNVIAGNAIDNNRGANDTFFFVGVELGNANEELQGEDLDYLPSHQNLVVGNRITGPHYAGVLISHGCEGNIVSRNVIRGNSNFAILCGSRLSTDLSGNEYDGHIVSRTILPFL